MIDVGIFGCSFSAHSWPVTWPVMFAERHNDFNVFDYSYPGTSLEYSVYCYMEFKKQYPHAKTIFQLTTPNRLTRKRGSFIKKQHLHNYCRIAPAMDEIDTITVANIGRDNKKITKYLDKKLKTEDEKINQAVLECMLYFIYKETDFSFTHRTRQVHRNLSSPCIEDILDKKTWLSFCRAPMDAHFNPDGMSWIADWVYDKVKTWN